MKYPVLLESFHENESKVVCATDIVEVFQDGTNEDVTGIHLSDGNSHEIEFKEKTEKATGKTVHVADAGMIIDFGKTPF
mgnify:CR=1 FL=1